MSARKTFWCILTGLCSLPATIFAQKDSIAQLEARIRAGDSLDAETEFRLGRYYEFARRYDDEERALRTAIAADPRYAPAYLWLGDLPYVREPKLIKDEQKDRVPPEWTKALDDAARLRVRALLIDPLVDWRARDEKPIPQDMVSVPEYSGYEKETTNYLGWIGIAGLVYERYELSYSAIDLYRSRRFPSSPDDSIPQWVFFVHGLAAAHLSAYDKASADFEVLMKRATTVERSDSVINFPLNTNDFRYLLAIFKERMKKPADAVQLYQDAINADLGFYMAHAHLAQLYRQYKMWDKAVAEAQAAVDANPEDPSLPLDLGLIDAEAGRGADAIAALKKAVALDPRYPEAYYRLGLVAQQANQTTDARDAFTRFIALAPHQMGTEIADAKQRLSTLP
ncbi:MAG TPA: tetratricopeptide repeat protein [Gemmatimonadales bacterium]|jgi:tetratricopeptide (TPR) repeat protein|nr:tetratricopeptide repeat protein [Gemmatimonadales bacterium]